MSPVVPTPALLALAGSLWLCPADAAATPGQELRTAPLTARARVLSVPSSVGTPFALRIEVEAPAVPLAQALATGAAARFQPEPRFEEWQRIPNLPLVQVAPGEDSGAGRSAVRFHWVCRWEPELPGEFTLPPLTIDCLPSAGSGSAVTMRLEPVRFKVPALIPGDPAKAAPRPEIELLPGTAGGARGGAAVVVILLLAASAAGYAWTRDAGERFSGPPQPASAGDLAVERLRAAQTAGEAYQALREFLAETAGLDVSRAAPEQLRAHPRLGEEGWRVLGPLLEALQAGAYSRRDAPLSAGLRDAFRKVLQTLRA